MISKLGYEDVIALAYQIQVSVLVQIHSKGIRFVQSSTIGST